MNEDQVIGTLIKLAGKVQTKFGHLLGNNYQINNGVRKQIFGEAQKSYGKAIESMKNRRKI